ncbi:MAG: exodeoxyribonuclease VII large subunit, partial [Defluviitaleaceae bacterium]|nr:exodeoxyribonuclease VII large subunit [Defluviitaleaceae bacterium]
MTQPKSFKVSQIANYLKELLEDDVLLSGFFIEGEISNFRLHSRGHMYFSIKDDRAAINSVMFAREAAGLDFAPAEGQRVLIYGRISHYAAGGATQLIAEIMNPLGIGEMHLAFVALKEKLEKEGIFANKRPLPEFPRAVAVVTSPTGAAIRDIITIMRRRNPLVAVFVVPALVQGVDAPRSIVAAIDLASKSGADALICGRGGGSAEDLAAFNTEAVARAVFGASIPVISAVGHETDFS